PSYRAIPLRLNMARRRAALFQVLLVILLRSPERPRRRNLRRHRPPQLSARLQRRLRFLRRRFLLGRVKENRRAVLRAIVRPLPVHLRRIMHLPERIQQFLVADLLRIKRYLHHLGVPGLVRANILVCRIGHIPAAISGLRRNHARDSLKISLDPPKASRTKSSNLTHVFALPRRGAALSRPFSAVSLQLANYPVLLLTFAANRNR